MFRIFRFILVPVPLVLLASCMPVSFGAPAATPFSGAVAPSAVVAPEPVVPEFSGETPTLPFVRSSPLQDFDLLPEEHKELVGHIVITRVGNTAIRGLSATGAGDYFESAWAYSGGKLEQLDLSGSAEAPYRAAAKRFFGKISAYKLATHDVGAMTKNFSMRKGFPDVYLVSNAAPEVLVHEMGHVVDYKYSFTDFADPKWPWTRAGAINGYGATHTGEDFAECYRFYVLDGAAFRDIWAKESKEVAQKYAYLKKRVFKGEEFGK